jgi:hypothetical protein
VPGELPGFETHWSGQQSCSSTQAAKAACLDYASEELALLTGLVNPSQEKSMKQKTQAYIFRQCITLRNGKRICKPKGQAFRIPVASNDNDDSKPE